MFHHTDYNILAMQTAVEVFKRIILEMEKADGNGPPEEKKCAVMWKCIQDISKLICWRQEAQLHQLANRDLTDTKTLQWNFSAPLWCLIDLHSKPTGPTVDKTIPHIVTARKTF